MIMNILVSALIHISESLHANVLHVGEPINGHRFACSMVLTWPWTANRPLWSRGLLAAGHLQKGCQWRPAASG